MAKKASTGEKTQDDGQLTADWLDIGMEMVVLVCKKLDIKIDYIDKDVAARLSAHLAKDIGRAAITHLRLNASKLETQDLFRKLGVGE